MAPSKDNFWSSFRDLHLDGGSQDSGRNGKDAEMHAIIALLTTGPVGLGDTCVGDECMVNATLVRRLARADGILLKPDRPLAPMDAQFGGLLPPGTARAMPGLCTVTQEGGPHPEVAQCGARLWQTHATIYPEDTARAPELVTEPIRRLVSHPGVDATLRRTVPEALAAAGPRGYLMQQLVVSVDQHDSFALVAQDLYPAPPAQSLVFWRPHTDGGPPCVAGADALQSGCVSASAANGTLFDVTTGGSGCSQPPYPGGFLPAGPNCLHAVGLWIAFPAAPDATFVLLGDLSSYVSLSGYRFRLPAGGVPAGQEPGESLIVVGMPGERLNVTYLRRQGVASAWKVHVDEVRVGAGGRTAVVLGNAL